ncbi:MAG: alpha/beta hydrolase [Asgard group archaeon]|nr:alpha/beta hydrolase [Asgard group archaeon]
MAMDENEFDLTQEQMNQINNLIENSPKEAPDFFEEGECEQFYIPVDGGEIRVFHRKPKKVSAKRPILFIPGFATTPWSWRGFPKSIHNNTEYYFLETREKKSSKIKRNRKANFRVDQKAKDIAQAIKFLGLDKKDFVLFGTSYCGGIVLQGLIQKYFTAPTIVVFDPSCNWAYMRKPIRWLLPIIPPFILGAMRFIFAKIFLAGMKNQHQKERNLDFISGADPYKWRKACMQNLQFDITNEINTITEEVFVVHGTKDKFHPGETFYKYSKDIPKGRFIYFNCENEKREFFNGVIGSAFANVTKEKGMPDEIASLEIDLQRT